LTHACERMEMGDRLSRLHRVICVCILLISCACLQGCETSEELRRRERIAEANQLAAQAKERQVSEEIQSRERIAEANRQSNQQAAQARERQVSEEIQSRERIAAANRQSSETWWKEHGASFQNMVAAFLGIILIVKILLVGNEWWQAKLKEMHDLGMQNKRMEHERQQEKERMEHERQQEKEKKEHERELKMLDLQSHERLKAMELEQQKYIESRNFGLSYGKLLLEVAAHQGAKPDLPTVAHSIKMLIGDQQADKNQPTSAGKRLQDNPTTSSTMQSSESSDGTCKRRIHTLEAKFEDFQAEIRRQRNRLCVHEDGQSSIEESEWRSICERKGASVQASMDSRIEEVES